MQNKKLAFGMMRLPQLDDNPEHVDLEKTCEMVDAFLQKGIPILIPVMFITTAKARSLPARRW